MKRVAITSTAARTPFGDLRETWDRLLRGHHIDDHARLGDLGSKGRALTLARIVADDAMSRRSLDSNAAIIVGTSKGTVEDWLHSPATPPTSDNPAGCSNGFGLSEIAGAFSARFGGHGPLLTLSAACASGLHALIRGAMMIRSGEVRQALIVAAEASVHPLFLGSFQRLGILAAPGAGCRPFDECRTGFYMSEAACAVVLEAVADDAKLPEGSALVENFALGGDAVHVTGGDPEARLLRHLLHEVIDGRPIDLVHAHGTGTTLNDATELSAIDATLIDQPTPPVVYSHKGALGHSLGASGLLSVVLNCSVHAAGLIPPNVLTTKPLRGARVLIPQSETRRDVRRSLAVAAGFGGPTAVVSLVGP